MGGEVWVEFWADLAGGLSRLNDVAQEVGSGVRVGQVNRPGIDGGFGLPRVPWSRFAGFHATVMDARFSNPMGASPPRAECRRRRLWKISR